MYRLIGGPCTKAWRRAGGLPSRFGATTEASIPGCWVQRRRQRRTSSRRTGSKHSASPRAALISSSAPSTCIRRRHVRLGQSRQV